MHGGFESKAKPQTHITVFKDLEFGNYSDISFLSIIDIA